MGRYYGLIRLLQCRGLFQTGTWHRDQGSASRNKSSRTNWRRRMSVVHGPRGRYPRSSGSNATRPSRPPSPTPIIAHTAHVSGETPLQNEKAEKDGADRNEKRHEQEMARSRRCEGFQSLFRGRNPRSHRAEPSEIKPSGSPVVAAVKLRTPGTRNSLIIGAG
jgi:hypothetical protein